MNYTICMAHQLFPFHILYGVERTLPIDFAVSKYSTYKVQAVSGFLQQCQPCFNTVKTALAKSNKQIAIYTYKHPWDTHLNVGNIVYVSTARFPLLHQLSCKLTLHLDWTFLQQSYYIQYCIHVQLPAEYGHMHPVFHVKLAQAPLRTSPPFTSCTFTTC